MELLRSLESRVTWSYSGGCSLEFAVIPGL